MPSWRKVGQLVVLCAQRQDRAAAEIARIERARQRSLDNEQWLERQMAEIAALLTDRMGQNGVMDKAGLYEARRRLAVLQRQKIELRLERQQATLESLSLQQQGDGQRQHWLALEKKRGRYQAWIDTRRRQTRQGRDLLEQTDIEERTPWGKS
jgi:hypothetical protein